MGAFILPAFGTGHGELANDVSRSEAAPPVLSAFEIEACFTFSEAERASIETRRRSELRLGLALQIGFLRMSGRLFDALRVVPPGL
jgi:hypothetical protein